MKEGHFRHVPVVDDEGKLVAMLSDRDVRLIHPSQAFVAEEQAALELTSATVSQAAVYDPVTVRPDTAFPSHENGHRRSVRLLSEMQARVWYSKRLASIPPPVFSSFTQIF